jgi:hypothetical protein
LGPRYGQNEFLATTGVTDTRVVSMHELSAARRSQIDTVFVGRTAPSNRCVTAPIR